MTEEISPRLPQEGPASSIAHRYVKPLTLRAARTPTLIVMLLLSITAIAAIPARAQSEEKGSKIEEEAPKTEVKTVDTAAVLARLNSMNENKLLLKDTARNQPTTFVVAEPVVAYSPAMVPGRAEVVPSTPQSSSSDGPQFQFTPYLWFIGLKGEVGPPARPAYVDVTFKEIFDELNFGFMAAFEARWGGKWRFLVDMNYANLSDDKATPGPLFDSVQATVKTFFIDPEIGYAIVGNNKSSVDVLGGIRYWHLSTAIELRRAAERINVEVSSNFVDVVGGLRAKIAISEKAFLTAKADVGGGGSDLTYQFAAGIGFNLGKRLAASFGYRYLHVNYRSSTNVFDVAQKGLITGFGFRF